MDQPGRLDPGGLEGSLGQLLKGRRESLERGFLDVEGQQDRQGQPVPQARAEPKAPQEILAMMETILWFLADAGQQGLPDRLGREALGATSGNLARMETTETEVLRAGAEPPEPKGLQDREGLLLL